MGKRKDQKAAGKPPSVLDVVDGLTRAANAIEGIEDAVRGAADLQGSEMGGVCTLLDMVQGEVRRLAADLKPHIQAA